MALVQVDHGRIDAERRERLRTAGAEQAVLGQTNLRAALIKPPARPPGGGVVLGEARVEQEQRHAADGGQPHLERDLVPEQRDGQLQRPAVVADDERERQLGRVVLEPVLLLPAGRVDPLAEVAAPVEQADGDHGHAAIAGLLQDVAGQDAQAPGVHRKRNVDAVLGAEEGDRAVQPRRRRRGLAHGLGDLPGQPADAVGEAHITLGVVLGMARQAGQEPHRVLAHERPAHRVDGGEHVGPARVPAPAVVVRHAGQRAEPGGEPPPELLDALTPIAWDRQSHGSVRARGWSRGHRLCGCLD